MRGAHRLARLARGLASALLILLGGTAAVAAPPAWTRSFDGTLDQASITVGDLTVTFGCAQGGPRPASGFIRIEARNAPRIVRAMEGKYLFGGLPVIFRAGGKTASAVFTGKSAAFLPEIDVEREKIERMSRTRAMQFLPPRETSGPIPDAQLPPPGYPPPDGVLVEFLHEADPVRAAEMAAIVKLLSEARGEVKIQIPALDAEWPVSLPGAARALRAMDRGCIDYLPEPDDEEQGPWQQGISTSDEGRQIMLVTQGRTPEGAPVQLKLAIVCDAGELTVRLILGDHDIRPPASAALRDLHHHFPIPLNVSAGPGANEASLSAQHAADLIRYMRAARNIRGEGAAFVLHFETPGLSLMNVAFDVFGFDMATRSMRTVCAIPE